MIKKIYGAPGTGKTTRMLNLLQQEIEAGTPLEKIAFVTHTVAAKLEVADRITKIMPIAGARTKLKYFRTIHGICYQELELSKDNVMRPSDYLDFGEQVGVPFSASFTRDIDMDGLPVGFNLSGGNSILAARQYASAMGGQVSDYPDEWPRWASPQLIKEVITKYAKFKERHAKFDFVDMLEMYVRLGDPIPVDVAFIDEAQDLSSFQWKIVDKMFANCKKIYLAGDDDQAIYGFIGADRAGFLDHASDEIEILPKSYRLRRNIWNRAQTIISQVEKRQPKEVAVRDDGGDISLYNNDLRYLDFSGETMVIARHHQQLQDLSEMLESRGIPFKGDRKHSIIGSAHSKLVKTYFELRRGDSVELRDAARLVEKLGNRDRALELRREARENDYLIGAGSLDLNFDTPWAQYLGTSVTDMKRNAIMKSVLNNTKDLEALVTEPKVSLTTYHGSKGREADHVVLLTDCFRAAWYGAVKRPDDERRLAYVGVTRAKERLTIVAPQSNMFMRSLL